jgi:hypothetical protein
MADVNLLITDDRADDAALAAIRRLGCDVVCV